MTVVTATQSLPDWSPITVTASCPKGYVVIGGGHECDDWRVWIRASRPTAAGDGWTVVFEKDDKGSRSCTVYAICAQVPEVE